MLDLHHAATGGYLPGGQVGKLIKPVQQKVDFAVLLAAWGRFVASSEAKYGPSYFLRNLGHFTLPDPPKRVFRGVLSEDDIRALGR